MIDDQSLHRVALETDWRAVKNVNPAWVYAALGFFGLSVLFFAAMLIDDRLLHGTSVWAKPAKFAVSLALYFATLLVFAHCLRIPWPSLFGGRWVPQSLVFVATGEMLYIMVQAAQGQPSHFNVTTPLYSAMYALMGFGAVWLCVGLAWFAWAVVRTAKTTQPIGLAIVMGLALSTVFGGGFGVYLGGQSSHWVNASPTDANGLWLFSWATDGGDLRVPHFFGLHAMQIIPMFAQLVPHALSTSKARYSIFLFSALYGCFCLWTFGQAIQGRAFL